MSDNEFDEENYIDEGYLFDKYTKACDLYEDVKIKRVVNNIYFNNDIENKRKFLGLCGFSTDVISYMESF